MIVIEALVAGGIGVLCGGVCALWLFGRALERRKRDRR